MKTYDIFLFDADGTLYDYDKSELNALKITFDYYGFDYEESILQKYKEINCQSWKTMKKAKSQNWKCKLQDLFDFSVN